MGEKKSFFYYAFSVSEVKTEMRPIKQWFSVPFSLFNFFQCTLGNSNAADAESVWLLERVEM